MENRENILDPAPLKEQADPRKDLLKGIHYTLIYLAAGLGLAALSYAVVGHPYIHAPGVHHWLIFLTFTGSLVWAIAAVVRYISGTRTWKLKGIILTNTLAVLAFILAIYLILREEGEGITEVKEEISMSEHGDTTTLYYNDNIIYMEVRDSIVLNFIDSTEFQRIVDSTGIKKRESGNR